MNMLEPYMQVKEFVKYNFLYGLFNKQVIIVIVAQWLEVLILDLEKLGSNSCCSFWRWTSLSILHYSSSCHSMYEYLAYTVVEISELLVFVH